MRTLDEVYDLSMARAEIRGLFVRRGLVLVGVGVTIGFVAAAGFTRFMQSLLFGISPLDPITFTAMPLALAAAAIEGPPFRATDYALQREIALFCDGLEARRR